MAEAGSSKEASYPPLERVLQMADQIIGTDFERAKQNIVTNIITRAAEEPAQTAVQEWIPRVEQIVLESLEDIITEVMKNFQTIVGECIEEALGPVGIVAFRRLVKSEWVCALPCECEEGCLGQEEDEEE